MSQAKGQLDIQFYGKIGTGRPSPNGEYQPTITYKGRFKQTIEFVAAKSVDIRRKEEAYNLFNFIKSNSHPHIVKFYDWYQTDHHLYFILEYCPGGTLLELLEQDVRLPEPIIRIFASDIIDALFFLHTNGAILRDIQPRNILIDECGSLKIGDLSKAASLDKPTPLSNNNAITDSEMLEYIAPELLAEIGSASFASDLYSLGALLYRMASGSVPFKSSNPDEPPVVTDEPPPVLVGYSNEFNSLVQSLLQKDPSKRLTWEEVIAHPFWGEILKDRPKNSPTDFNVNRLPQQTRLDRSKQISSFSRRTNSIIIPKQGTPESARTSSRSSPKTIEALMMTSDLFKIQPIFLNSSIEETKIPEFDQESLHIAYDITSDSKEERMKAFEQVVGYLKDPSMKRKEKFPYISFLIYHSQTDDIADTIAETEHFCELLKFALDTKYSSLSCGYLLIFGSVIRNARTIPPAHLSAETLAPLENLVNNEQEKIARKAIMALGEVAYYIATAKSPLAFPRFTAPALLNALKSTDEVMKHYAIRIIANLLLLPKATDLFTSLGTLEQNLINFDFGVNPNLLDLYGTCLCELSLIHPLTKSDTVEEVIKVLMATTSSTTKVIGLMLATANHSLEIVKKDLGRCLCDTIYDLRIKALLAVCLSFSNDLQGFISIAARFFLVIDKFAQELPPEVIAAAQWSAQIAKNIVSGNDYSLFQIITQALPVKACRERIWTAEFEKAFGEKLAKCDFTDHLSYNALQVLEAAVHESMCSIELVTYIAKAFESPFNDTRFLSLKIVADANATTQPPELAEFVLNSVLPLAPKLLEVKQADDSLIADQVLKILSFTANSHNEYVPRIAQREILPHVFSKVCQSPSALLLTYHIVQYSDDVIDNFVQAGLLDAICKAIEKPNYPESFGLLCAILKPIANQLIMNQESQQVQKVIEMIVQLATLAKYCAERLFSSPKTVNCLKYEFFIFSSMKSATDCLFTDCFVPLADRINEVIFKPDIAQQVADVLSMLNYVAAKSEITRNAVKDCKELVSAIRDASKSVTVALSSQTQKLLQILFPQPAA